MIYSSIVKMKIRQTFNHVNNHRWDKATEALAPDIHHRVSGDHALGGERHDKDSCPALVQASRPRPAEISA